MISASIFSSRDSAAVMAFQDPNLALQRQPRKPSSFLNDPWTKLSNNFIIRTIVGLSLNDLGDLVLRSTPSLLQ